MAEFLRLYVLHASELLTYAHRRFNLTGPSCVEGVFNYINHRAEMHFVVRALQLPANALWLHKNYTLSIVHGGNVIVRVDENEFCEKLRATVNELR